MMQVRTSALRLSICRSNRDDSASHTFRPRTLLPWLSRQRRKGAEPDLRRQRCDDAAADAALGGNADAIDPFAGIVVHARTGHHGQRAGNDMRRQHLHAGHRIDAAIGKRRRHHGEIARGDQDGALPEVDVEHRVDVVLHDQIVAQQPGDGPVAVAGRALGGMHRLVDAELAPGKAAELVADALERGRALGLMDQPGAGDRAGIDHRVERPVVVGQPDRVERLAARLDADRGRRPALRRPAPARARTRRPWRPTGW